MPGACEISLGVKSFAWGKLTRAASLLSAILLFAVTLEKLPVSWATVIMWVLSGEVRSWSLFNQRLMRGWVIQVMRVERVRGGGLRRESASLIFMRP